VERVLVGELMDDPGVDPAELARALAYIRGVNRLLFGTRACLHHLERWSRRWPKDAEIRVLDVGTGSADIPLAIVRWARERGRRVHITAIDNHEKTLDVARGRVREAGAEGAIELLSADALTLEARFAPGSFDYAHAGLFLHHLQTPDAGRVLGAMHRLSRRGVIWNDLVRSRWGAVAVHAILVGQPRMVKHDAVASVRAGFTRAEAERMARDVGAPHLRWRTWLLHRFTLAGERPDAWDTRDGDRP
jgi:ubiquinone/menaquinone biosynthesis C-methylase UbiE